MFTTLRRCAEDMSHWPQLRSRLLPSAHRSHSSILCRLNLNFPPLKRFSNYIAHNVQHTETMCIAYRSFTLAHGYSRAFALFSKCIPCSCCLRCSNRAKSHGRLSSGWVHSQNIQIQSRFNRSEGWGTVMVKNTVLKCYHRKPVISCIGISSDLEAPDIVYLQLVSNREINLMCCYKV